MNWQEELNQTWVAILTAVACIAALVWIVRSIAKGRSTGVKARLIVEDAPPTCVCGALATHPAPYLEWARTGVGAWLRKLHGAPPRYDRKVNNMHAHIYCEMHARIADTALDQFVFDVRKQYSDLNHKIASDAAKFENEGLAVKIADTLTPTQKRQKSNVTRLVRNGTTDVDSPS